MKIFTRNFFLGVGAGIVITTLIPVVEAISSSGGIPERICREVKKYWKAVWRRHLFHQLFWLIMIGLFNLSRVKISK